MKHGTITGYTTHKCKCADCRKAWRDYSRQWARDSRASHSRLIDAAETCRHLVRLIGAGNSAAGIGTMTGLSAQAVINILGGKTQRVKRTTADRVMSVTLNDKPGARNLVPSAKARDMLVQMRRSGILAKTIVAMLGYKPTSSIPTARHQRIAFRNHRRICVLYELLARQGKVPASLLEEANA